MSGTVVGHQMFTIEQIELIRRLRNSGITKEQLCQAFDSLERLDRELGMLYNVPTTSANSQNRNNRVTNGNPCNKNFQTSSSLMVFENPNVSPQNNDNTSPRNLQQEHNQLDHQQQFYHQQQSYHGQHHQGQITPSSSSSSQQTYKINHIGPLHAALLNAQPTVQIDEIPDRGIKRQHIETIDLDSVESSASFDDDSSNLSALDSSKDDDSNYLKQKKSVMAAEVQSFISQYEFKKEMISAMSGVNMAVVEQFLQGDYQNISDKSFDCIYAWYLGKKKNFAVNQHHKPAPGVAYPQKLKFPDGQEVLMPPQRRERFTFREKHLEILERCFKENPYPSQEQRDTIADMCNIAISNNGARNLLDREKVTTHMVLNWFANRRKEVKKIAREEGIATSSVVLPSRLSKNRTVMIEPEYTDQKGTELQSYHSSDFQQTESTDNTIDSIETIVFKQEYPD